MKYIQRPVEVDAEKWEGQKKLNIDVPAQKITFFDNRLYILTDLDIVKVKNGDYIVVRGDRVDVFDEKTFHELFEPKGRKK